MDEWLDEMIDLRASRLHKMRIAKEKPYVCPLCGSRFKEQFFKCEKCGGRRGDGKEMGYIDIPENKEAV